MNYLISTLDGFGDGVIYYPIFKTLCLSRPDDIFYCTNNIFFLDKDISDKLNLPENLKFISEEFRRFPQDKWSNINDFIDRNKIEKIINLRFIGRKFEIDYFKFKDFHLSNNSNLEFFDSEDISFDINGANVREVISKIFEKAFDIKIQYEVYPLKDIFSSVENFESIFINMHSRGEFKLWNIKKWSEIISSMVFYGKKICVYEGFNEQEKEYTKSVLDCLTDVVRNNIEILSTNNLSDLISSLRKTKLLISIDSGLIHLADSMGINSIGIYLTTSPKVWGGVSNKFHFVSSNHLKNCTNYYSQFGMCMNNKKKCEEIMGDKDDIDIHDIFNIVNNIYEKQD